MKYINPKSRRGIVNMLADHIVKNFNPIYKTRIQVVDFKSFFVVCGSTNSEERLNINKIVEDFINAEENVLNFLKITNINIIDLIEYGEPIIPTDYHFTFHKTVRPSYHQKIINEVFSQPFPPKYNKELIASIELKDKINIEFLSPFIFSNIDTRNHTNFHSIASEFPHGYSLNLGRSEYYYSEYICNHLFDLIHSKTIYFNYTNRIVNDDYDIDIEVDSIYSKKDILSLILDVFDFDLEKFNNEYIKDYDITNDIKDPFGDKPWLIKDRIKDMIIF